MTENGQNSPEPDRSDIERIQRLVGPRYQLQRVIGRGGMSTVWLASSTEDDQLVAIKVLKPEYTDNAEFRERFHNEATASSMINSPNVVRTYTYREVRDAGMTFCFIIMEYVRGESLADVLARERQLPESRAVDVLAQAALGLAAIHAAGMVHRDIKPGNLLITPDGTVKVADFGIAKAAEAVPITRTGMVVGTAQYVSPEQAQGIKVTPATDIYSLGVVGYEMLTGQRPFTGESTVSIAIAHINEPPPALPLSISRGTRELIATALRKDPKARYANGNELAHAVSAVQAGQMPPAPAAIAAGGVADGSAPTSLLTAQGGADTTASGSAAGQGVSVASGVPASPANNDQDVAEKKAAKATKWLWTLIALLVLVIVVIGAWFAFAVQRDGSRDSTGQVTTSRAPQTSKKQAPKTTEAPEPTQESGSDAGTVTVRVPAPNPQPAPETKTQPESQPEPTAAPENNEPVPWTPTPVAPKTTSPSTSGGSSGGSDSGNSGSGSGSGSGNSGSNGGSNGGGA